ncbi:tetratricopeptide repeat protein [Candidatus Uhrbacteria bacterium]|nr:tetratricopeptide repeat protein [Candidatus Uhrbacteria bacterium]
MELSSSRAAASVPLRRKKTPMGQAGIYQAVTRWSLGILFFLLPLFFLPATVDAFEVNKQTLFVILTSVALLSWLGSMVVEKRLSFRAGWINLGPLLIVVGALVSSIFSLAGYQTWVGQAVQEYTSFLTLAMSAVLFYVLVNTAHEPRVQRNLFVALLASGALAGLVTVLVVFGVPLPMGLGEIRGFNTIGTINAFVTFLTVVTCLGIGWWLGGKKGEENLLPEGWQGNALRGLIAFIGIVTLLLLLAIDFWVFWVIAMFGMVLLLAFAFLQQGELGKTNRFTLPLLFLLVAVLFLFLPSPLRLNLPVVVSPSYGASWNLTTSVLKESPLRLAFGSGPGTFAYDYTKYRSESLNAGNFWSVRFDRAKSHILTTVTTFGVVGGLLWVLFVVAVALKALARLLKERDHADWKITYATFGAWGALVCSLVLYSSNMTFQFLFWALTGLLVAQVARGVKETDFGRSPKLGLVFSFGFMVVAIGVLTTLFVTGQRYASEIAYAQAVRLDRAQAPAVQIIQKMGRAVSYNSLSDVYYRNLSQALLKRTREVIAEAQAAAGEGGQIAPEQSQQIQRLVVAAVNASKRATDLAPNNVSNWVVRANVYRDVMSFVSKAEDFSAASYEQAVKLEPANPANHVNLGRLYLAIGDRARSLKASENAELAKTAVESEQKTLASAEEILLRAIALKPDYAPAHYYLAGVFERQGRLPEAVARMEALRNYSPTDIGLGFQLSMMYLRIQNYDAARAELERLVKISPNYSNALWYLASVYEIKGDLQAALKQVEKVAELNPDNALVQVRLQKLRAGELTTRIPQPVEEGNEEAATSVEGGEVVSDASAPAEEGVEGVPAEEEDLVDQQ